MGSEQLKNI